MRQGTAEPKVTYTISLTGYRLVKGEGWWWTMDRVPPELTAILHEIEKALDAKLYYLAIAVALSVPDICACLECEPDKIWTTRETYVAWCDRNLASRFTNLSGIDFYRLRCGVLHQGNFGHPKSKFDRVMFIGPESQIKAHDVVITVAPGVKIGGIDVKELRLEGQLLQLDVALFCKSIIDAAREWSIAKIDDANVQANLASLVRYRPNGLPPFSVGVPTIA